MSVEFFLSTVIYTLVLPWIVRTSTSTIEFIMCCGGEETRLKEWRDEVNTKQVPRKTQKWQDETLKWRWRRCNTLLVCRVEEEREVGKTIQVLMVNILQYGHALYIVRL